MHLLGTQQWPPHLLLHDVPVFEDDAAFPTSHAHPDVAGGLVYPPGTDRGVTPLAERLVGANVTRLAEPVVVAVAVTPYGLRLVAPDNPADRRLVARPQRPRSALRVPV